MALYQYVAKDANGQTITSEIIAEHEKMVKDMLRQNGLTIISISEVKRKASLNLFSRASSGKIKIDDIVIFARQMATMINSGIPIVTALDILSEQSENKSFASVLVKIKGMVESGASLSEAMGRHPKVFSGLFVSMIRAGEISGKLDEIMERLAVYVEKTSALQKKIKSAMIYPSVVSGMAVVISLVLMIKVIPVFKDIFASFDATLPVPTQILINVSDVMREYFLVWIGVMVAGFFLLSRYLKTDIGRRQRDGFLLKAPVFGTLFTKVGVSKFTRTLATLVVSGIPMLQAIEIVAKTSGNTVIEAVLEKVRRSVRQGEGISVPLSKSQVFPPMVVRMIAIGEQTGELDKMLGKISDFYDEQVDIAVSGLTSLLEPLIIAFLGIVIGGIVICMFMPIFKLSTIIQF